MNRIEIIGYRSEHQPYFERFNKAWIEADFRLEEIDTYVLQHPEEAILAKGGAILMAVCDGEVAGDVYEFTKMAVDAAFRRRGLAEALSYAALDKAEQLGAKTVVLYSNTILAPAIALYKKLGFTEVPLEKGVYQRSDIKMEIAIVPAFPKAKGTATPVLPGESKPYFTT